MIHSQKTNALLSSSRALYIDGLKMYSNRSRNTAFYTMVEGNTLKFKIEFLGNTKYRYLLAINDVPHQIAYKQWAAQQKLQNAMDSDDYSDDNDQESSKAKSKSAVQANKKTNWLLKKNKLPVFTSLAHCVPDRSFESEEH